MFTLKNWGYAKIFWGPFGFRKVFLRPFWVPQPQKGWKTLFSLYYRHMEKTIKTLKVWKFCTKSLMLLQACRNQIKIFKSSSKKICRKFGLNRYHRQRRGRINCTNPNCKKTGRHQNRDWSPHVKKWQLVKNQKHMRYM